MESNVVESSDTNSNQRLKIWFHVGSVEPTVGNGTFCSFVATCNSTDWTHWQQTCLRLLNVPMNLPLETEHTHQLSFANEGRASALRGGGIKTEILHSLVWYRVDCIILIEY